MPWTSLMSATNQLTAALVARDPIVRGSVMRALRECRVRFAETTMEQLARADETPDVVCTGPSGASAVLGLGFPTVIVTRGVSVSDEVWAELLQRRPVVLSHDDLTPVTLLEGFLMARFGIDVKDVPSSLSQVPLALLRGFLSSPRTLRTIRDAARASGCSLDEVRAVERELGCRRFEGLAARLRAETWRWLVRAGTDRSVVEDYLGIKDRSDFRRACRRAGIPIPWGDNERT